MNWQRKMFSIRKWLYKPKRSDTSLLAQFFYADEELNMIAAELDSFDGRKDPERCTALVNQLRMCQDKVLGIIQQIMDDVILEQRANRDFRVKFPDDVLQESLAGQLWFGAECLAAGSSIMNREVESASMRPLARALTRHLDHLRSLLRDQCLRNSNYYTDKTNLQYIKEGLVVFDHLFAEFELSYVSAMVPVKTMKEYDILQDVIVLFSESVNRALKVDLLTQDMIDDYDPALMFTIPRLAIVCGLLIFPEGPLNPDQDPKNMSEMFRPFQTLLFKIRELLWTLSSEELISLEKSLCSTEEPGLYRDVAPAPYKEEITSNKSPCTGFQNWMPASFQGGVTVRCSDRESRQSESSDGLQVDQSDFGFARMSQSPSTMTIVPNPNYSGDESQSSTSTEVGSVPKGMLHQDSSDSGIPSDTCSSCDGALPQGGAVSSGGGADSVGGRSSSEACSMDLGVEQRRPPIVSLKDFDDRIVSIPQEVREICRTIVDDLFSEASGNAKFELHRRRPEFHLNLGRRNDTGLAVPTPIPTIMVDGSSPGAASSESSSAAGEGGRVEEAMEDEVSSSSSSSSEMTTPTSTLSLHIDNTHFQAEQHDSGKKDQSERIISTFRSRSGESDGTCKPPLGPGEVGGGNTGAPPPTPTGDCLDIPRVQRIRYSESISSMCSSCHSGAPSVGSECDWERESCASSETSSYNSECHDDEEIALAIQAAELATRNEARSRFRSSSDLIHRLFVCISGVADQLQTNYASDLRHILKAVFEAHCTEPLMYVQPASEAVASSSGQEENHEDNMAEGAGAQPRTGRDPPPWVPDESCPHCSSCKVPFTFVRRRHHCRNCGKIYCGRCSSNSVPLPHYGHDKPVRVCNHCLMFQVTPFTVDEIATP